MAKSINKEAAKLAADCAFEARYSGEQSQAFWNTINKSKNRMLYDFGVALQDLEGRVLRLVNEDIELQLRELLRKRRTGKQVRRTR